MGRAEVRLRRPRGQRLRRYQVGQFHSGRQRPLSRHRRFSAERHQRQGGHQDVGDQRPEREPQHAGRWHPRRPVTGVAEQLFLRHSEDCGQLRRGDQTGGAGHGRRACGRDQLLGLIPAKGHDHHQFDDWFLHLHAHVHRPAQRRRIRPRRPHRHIQRHRDRRIRGHRLDPGHRQYRPV